jgi:glycosyltransferase involved in cell wall biosynthesis
MKKRNKSKTIDILIPTYNEQGNINTLVDRLTFSLPSKYNYNLIFIDDGSSDGSLDEIKKINNKRFSIQYLSFSKNFGHQIALKAGLDISKGDCSISMDADLQHPPELIPEMILKWEQGDDIVYTKRLDNSNVSFFKKVTANLFYKLINSLSGLEIEQGAADFRLMDKKVVEVFKSFNERNLFIRGMVNDVGFQKSFIEYEPERRFWGKSKYSFKKMYLFALDGITSFSVKPLHLATILGIFISFFSIIYSIYAVLIFFTTDLAITGWTSILVSILLLGGIQLTVLGILGEYVGKMFLETKNRPSYIIKESKVK